MGFAENVKDLRKRMLLSQDEFAKELGVSFSTVNRWENGKTLPTYKTMKLIEYFCQQHSIDFSESMETWKEEK